MGDWQIVNHASQDAKREEEFGEKIAWLNDLPELPPPIPFEHLDTDAGSGQSSTNVYPDLEMESKLQVRQRIRGSPGFQDYVDWDEDVTSSRLQQIIQGDSSSLSKQQFGFDPDEQMEQAKQGISPSTRSDLPVTIPSSNILPLPTVLLPFKHLATV